MKNRFPIILGIATLLLPPFVAADNFDNGHWVDLTHEFSDQTISHPRGQAFAHTPSVVGMTRGGFYMATYNYSGSEHAGTHLDAPVHFHEGGRSVDDIPLERLMGNVVVIDVKPQVSADPLYLVSVEDVLAWEDINGAIPGDAIVMFNTGKSNVWPDKIAYTGTDKRGNEGVAELKTPAIHADTALFLATERKIRMIGLDSTGFDNSRQPDRMSHRILFEHDIHGMENVANLDSLPATGAYMIALPMKIADGSAAPVRVIAWVPDAPPDTILYNGNIITVDEGFSIAQSVAIANGRIVRVGNDAEITEMAVAETNLVDLDGKTVTPGFIDTHPHMIHVGSGGAGVVLAGVASIEDIKQKIAERVQSTPLGEWIFTSSVGNPRKVAELPGSLAENRWPTRADLDSVAPKNPVFIPTPWGGPKPAILNSLALKLMGINADTPDFDKGIEVIKDVSGQPTGLINGMHAYNYNPYYAKIMRFAPKHPVENIAPGVQSHISAFNARGLTAVYESHFLTPTNISVIQHLLERDNLTIRMKLAPEYWGARWQPPEAVEAWMVSLKARETQLGNEPPEPEILTVKNNDLVKMLGATVSSDGPISFGKAMMTVPYLDMHGKPASTDLPLTVEQIIKVAMPAAKHGLRLNFPVGGDRMTDTVIEALETVNKVHPLKGKGFLIAHTPYMTDQRLQRIVDLGVDVTANSNAEYKLNRARYQQIFGELAEEMSAINTPWRGLLDSGINVAQSTDNVFADPMFTLWQALKRASEADDETLMSPGKSINREEAIRLQTINGAEILQWDDEIGSIEAGKFADLVVLDTNILNCELDEIRDTKVLATYVGGELVYQHQETIN